MAQCQSKRPAIENGKKVGNYWCLLKAGHTGSHEDSTGKKWSDVKAD
jgi:hypothetical protein